MKLIVNLNSIDYLYDYIEMGVNDFVVGTPYFSCRQAINLEYDELEQLKGKYPHIHLFVLVNALIEEHNVEALKIHLSKLNKIGIDGILYQDYGVLNICLDCHYGFEKIYAPDTLNTNHQTINFLKTLGVDGAFLAREIPLEEKKKIAENVSLKTMVQAHGVEYMAYSKRPLLSNYKEITGLDFPDDKDANLYIQANQVDQKCHIYQDKFGCHILSEPQIYTLDVLNHFTCFDYLFIDGQYLEKMTLLEVVHLYVQAIESINKGNYSKESIELTRLLHQLTPNVQYYHSFLFDSTVYKISDVRKREENERSK
ncbi:peptidase U32 family protein [Erysipelatoclostridium sp. AM42-17]|uniref:peptidase U32 family protein n=1 Tax=Erysipelatoclostridium sp. AM42-17 TaxID=2293102 RepID=UPI000E51A337|nr:U32 family peptidase [Erysipelatoclostridium sp. AM42-17]RHS92219.1 U32 family peptidase [Erysipelatoclostridium sp. AM42-17]